MSIKWSFYIKKYISLSHYLIIYIIFIDKFYIVIPYYIKLYPIIKISYNRLLH